MEAARAKKGNSVASSSYDVGSRELVEYEPMWYEGEEWEERTNFIARRGLEPGRLVDLDFFSDERNLKVKMMIERLNLSGLLVFEKDEQRIYNSEIRQFYTYLQRSDNSAFRSFVNGRVLHFDAIVLEDALHIGGEGMVGQFNKKRAKRVLGLGKIRKSSLLDVDMHIMHYIMTFNILPSSGHRDAISADHMEMLYYLYEGIRPGIGAWIMRHMLNSIAHKQRNLPYGILLTRLFRHFNVPLEGREWDSVPNAPINANTLCLMGITADPQNPGMWMYIERLAGPPSSRRRSPYAEDDFVPELSAESVYLLSVEMENLSMQFRAVQEQTSSWHSQITSEFDSFGQHSQENMDHIRTEVSGLREEIQDMFHQQNRINEYLGNFLSEFRKP